MALPHHHRNSWASPTRIWGQEHPSPYLQDQSGFYVSTYGAGTNLNAAIAGGNQLFGPLLFYHQDALSRGYFNQHFASEKSNSGNPI
jgi:hypothetical protein